MKSQKILRELANLNSLNYIKLGDRKYEKYYLNSYSASVATLGPDTSPRM